MTATKIISRVFELTAFLASACFFAVVFGVLAAGLASFGGATDGMANGLGWVVCYLSFVLMAFSGKPSRS